MGFREDVLADTAEILGGVGLDDGETTEPVLIYGIDPEGPATLPASVARGQEGLAAINDRNRSLFDPERDAMTAGRLVLTRLPTAMLIASDLASADLKLGWALEFPDVDGELWDFARIESTGGGVVTALWIRRDAIEFGAHAGKRARSV
jgi:hypothetical protein